MLQVIPASVGVCVELAYATGAVLEERALGHGVDLNAAVDAVLRTIYDVTTQGAGQSRARRNVVFTSFSPDACAALNWKQPNCEYKVVSALCAPMSPCVCRIIPLFIHDASLRQTPCSSPRSAGGQACTRPVPPRARRETPATSAWRASTPPSRCARRTTCSACCSTQSPWCVFPSYPVTPAHTSPARGALADPGRQGLRSLTRRIWHGEPPVRARVPRRRRVSARRHHDILYTTLLTADRLLSYCIAISTIYH